MTGRGHRVAVHLSTLPISSFCLSCQCSFSSRSHVVILFLPLLLLLPEVVSFRIVIERMFSLMTYPYCFKFLFLTVILRSSIWSVSCLMARTLGKFCWITNVCFNVQVQVEQLKYKFIFFNQKMENMTPKFEGVF